MKYEIHDIHQFNRAGIGEQVHILRDTMLQRLRIEELTLRDQFAMNCLIDFNTFEKYWCSTTPTVFEYASFCYQYADAMLKAREDRI